MVKVSQPAHGPVGGWMILAEPGAEDFDGLLQERNRLRGFFLGPGDVGLGGQDVGDAFVGFPEGRLANEQAASFASCGLIAPPASLVGSLTASSG